MRRGDDAWRDRAVMVRRVRRGERELRWELVVVAPVEDVWRAWTEPEEIATWAAPAAVVELVPGGTWEAHFFPDAPEGERGGDASRVVRFEPHALLVLAAGAPVEFPAVRRHKTRFEVRLEPVGSAHTLVRVRQDGFRTGHEWDRAFERLAHMNAEWLNWLHRRFLHGPIDWSCIDFAMAAANDPDDGDAPHASH